MVVRRRPTNSLPWWLPAKLDSLAPSVTRVPVEGETVTTELVHSSAGVSEALPEAATPLEAEVDVELLRSVPQQFCIDSEGAATWLVRRIVGARQYAERVKKWSEQEQRRAAREEQTLM